MSTKLKHSVFYEVFFPSQQPSTEPQTLSLRQTYRFQAKPHESVNQVPWVIFDLETTGLSKDSDRIIELGGIKYYAQKEVERFSELIYVDRFIPPEVQKLTGIDPSMLEGKPTAQEVIPKFMEFIAGSMLVCHNSHFDMIMMAAELKRQNIVCDHPCLCTLKMSRSLLSELSSRKLSSLADHYKISYSALHRSLDDAKLTASVLFKMLEEFTDLSSLTFGDLNPYLHGS